VSRHRSTTPGFGAWSLGVGKKTSFGEQKYLLVRADPFSVLKHSTFALRRSFQRGLPFHVLGLKFVF
jgi:hypothetical protein